jgi:hypothetical protein
MFSLVAISMIGYGLYMAANIHLEAGIAVTASGLFSLFLAFQISDLKERLGWAETEIQKFSKKVAKPSPVAGVQKAKRKPAKAAEAQPLTPDPQTDFDDYAQSSPEESNRVGQNPPPLRPSASVSDIEPPKIVTRTSKNSGGYTQETWKGERNWSSEEVAELVELYSDGDVDVLNSIAIKMRLDKKDVAYKLTRLNFADSGDLEDLSEAPNDGKSWSKEDSKKLLEMNAAGITLSGMAKTFGRTKLAIGWRLADQTKLNKIR